MVWALTQWEAFPKIAFLLNVDVIRPSGFSFPLCQIPFLVRGLLRKSRILRLSLLLPPSLRERWVGPQDAPCIASRRASSPPARPGPAGGVEVLLDARPVLIATSVFLGSFGSGGTRSCSLRRTPVACSAPSSVGSPLSPLHALRDDELRESSEACFLLRSSRASRVSAREAWKDHRSRSRSDGSRDRSRHWRPHCFPFVVKWSRTWWSLLVSIAIFP